MNKTIWTHFNDMHSGGGRKEKWEHIFIEAPQSEALSIFYGKFGHNPERVSCTCCGSDYSIDDGEISQLSAYQRGCAWDAKKKKYVEKQKAESYARPYQTLKQFQKDENVLFIYAKDIKDEWRGLDVPEEGYVWQ